MKRWLQVFIAPMLCVSLACSKPIPAEPPVSSIQRDGKNLSVELIQGAHLDQVVNLDLFQGFSPGMTLTDAEAKIGPPDESGTESKGSDYVFFSEYRRPLGRVRVYDEHIVGEEESDGWWLEGYPDLAPLERHVVPQIVRQARADADDDWKLYLMDASHEVFVTLTLHGDRVSKIFWMKR